MGLIAKFPIKNFEICAPAQNINSPQFSKVKGVFLDWGRSRDEVVFL